MLCIYVHLFNYLNRRVRIFSFLILRPSRIPFGILDGPVLDHVPRRTIIGINLDIAIEIVTKIYTGHGPF